MSPAARTIRIAFEEGTHALEARVQDAAGSATAGRVVIAAPHPLYGGDADSPVVRELEAAFLHHGLGTLAFDYRGVGGSTGVQRGSLDEAVADFMSVARSEAAQPLVALAGYSFGACAALLAARTLEVPSLVLVAPALALLDPGALGRFTGRLRIVVGEHDDYAPASALESLAAQVPDAQLEVLPGVDHFFMDSQRLRLREALTRALGGE